MTSHRDFCCLASLAQREPEPQLPPRREPAIRRCGRPHRDCHVDPATCLPPPPGRPLGRWRSAPVPQRLRLVSNNPFAREPSPEPQRELRRPGPEPAREARPGLAVAAAGRPGPEAHRVVKKRGREEEDEEEERPALEQKRQRPAATAERRGWEEDRGQAGPGECGGSHWLGSRRGAGRGQANSFLTKCGENCAKIDVEIQSKALQCQEGKKKRVVAKHLHFIKGNALFPQVGCT